MGAAVQSIRSKAKVRVGPSSRPARYRSPIDKAKGHELEWKRAGPLFEAVRGIGGVTFVYFIGEEDNGPIKIGLSKDPIDRLRNMQTGNPRRLRVEHLLVGDLRVEKLIHEFWEAHVVLSSTAVSRRRHKQSSAPGTEWFAPEVRTALYPIVDTAQAVQIPHFAEPGPNMDFMMRAVRDAHITHDHIAIGRDQDEYLARGAGYVLDGRPSRI